MARIRQWWGIGAIGLTSLMSGCATDLPEFARYTYPSSWDITDRGFSTARAQLNDAPPVTLKKPVDAPAPLPIAPPPTYKPGQLPAPPPEFNPIKPAPFSLTPTLPPPGGIVQTAMLSRGSERVKVRAWVNCHPIFNEEIMQLAAPEMRRIFTMPDTQRIEETTKLINKVLDHLIDQELMYQDAVKRLEKGGKGTLDKLRQFVDGEYDKSVQKMRDAKVPEDQIRELEPTARRMLERNLISTEYARQRIMPILESAVNMNLIRDYYDAHKNEFQTVDKVVWQDIFIPLSVPNLPGIEDAKRFGEELINRCRRPEDFDRLMTYNEGDSKLRNGMGLGQLLTARDAKGKILCDAKGEIARPGDIRPGELEPYLYKLRQGEIGPVVAFSTGVHLIRVTKREYAGQMPFDDQTQKVIRKKLENEIADREFKCIVRELRLRSVIRHERDLP